MKISLIQEHLAKALIYINKAVSTRPNIPVLANVLLETEKGRLKLSATNLEIGINTWIGATISEGGKVTVSAKLLSDFVNSLKPGKLEIEQSNQKLVVKSVDNKAEFYVIPADDFPTIPEKEGSPIFQINAAEFADAIARTAFAAGTDESRPVLTGILMEATKKELTMVAVDGFRLSRKKLKLSEEIEKGISEIIPARALIEVERLVRDIDDEKETMDVYLLGNKNQMLFKTNDIELSTRLIEGKFPNYKQIIPTEKSLSFVIEKSEMVDMLKVVNIFARNVVGNKARYKVDAEKQELSLSANVIDVGNNESTIKINKVEGDDLETGYNAMFLKDMIGSIYSDKVIFETNGSTSPGVFLDAEDKNFLHIVMPMRLE